MTKKIKTNYIAKYMIFLGILLCLSAVVMLSFVNVPINDRVAKADEEPTYYRGYHAEDSEVHFNTASSYYKSEGVLGEEPHNYYQIPYVQSSTPWYERIASDLILKLTFKYESLNVVYSDIFDVNLRTTAGSSNQIYAYITNFTIQGKTWYGSNYNGLASNLKEAGVYKITALSVYYHVGAKCQAHADMNVSNAPAAPYATGTINLSSSLDVVVTSNLVIDASNSTTMGINDNLNINVSSSTYGNQSNFRNIVNIHSEQDFSDKNSFAYSTKVNPSYNISNNDHRFFRPFSDTGVGNFPQQTTNIEGSYSFTTLIGIHDKLQVQWNEGFYTGDNELILTEIPSYTPINAADSYYLKIVPIYVFDYDYKPLTTILSSTGKEYVQTLNIHKKVLNIDLVQKNIINFSLTKEYDKNSDAYGLFMNKALTQQEFVEAGGVLADHSVLSNLINSLMLFDFAGSVFDDAEIGNRNVTMFVNMRRIAAGDNSYGNDVILSKVLSNYLPKPGRVVSGTFTYYNMVSEANNSYALTGFEFKILPPQVQIGFNSLQFNGSFIYGEYMQATDFSYQKYQNGQYINSLDATNTTMDGSGKININNLDNWQIAFISKDADLKTDSNKNIIYIYIKVGKIAQPDYQGAIVYTDNNNVKYYSHSGRLYADDHYYFYYEVRAYFSSGNNQTLSQDADGSFKIPKTYNSTTDYVTTVSATSLLNLKILKREVAITITECVNEKVYDGNTVLNTFTAVSSNILSTDASFIKLAYDAEYAYAGVSNNVPINVNYYLVPQPGQEGQDLTNLIDSYAINTLGIVNNSGVLDVTKGIITPLTLDIKFLQTQYTIKYNKPMYVVVKVASAGTKKVSGETLTYDLFYYYGASVDTPYNGNQGYCYQSDLVAFGISNYVMVEITGFRQGEGFLWDDSNTAIQSFMLNMTTNPPISQTLNTALLLTWHDTIKDIYINSLTNSNEEGESYRLEFETTNIIAPNYVFATTTPFYAYLHIEKLDTDPDEAIKVEAEGEDKTLYYTGGSNISQLFDSDRIKLNGHEEYLQLPQPFTDLITVLDFTFSCTDSSHDHSLYNIDADNVKNMTLSGTYWLRLSLPATANYLPTYKEFEIIVNTITVDVYLTKAVRVFGEEEIVYDVNSPKYVTDIAFYSIMINSDGEIVAQNGNTVYVYKDQYGNIVEGNFVLYKGLVAGEYFGSDQNVDMLPTVVVNPSSPNAGNYSDAITVQGACKHNYTFNYHPTTLYVAQKELSIAAEEEQTKIYTGDAVSPDYQILGGIGNMVMYKIGKVINGVEIYDEEVDEKDNRVVDVGIYIIKIYAMPRIEDQQNYKVSNERLQIIFTIIEQQIVLKEEYNTADKAYDTLIFELSSFDYYFKGVSVTTPVKYEWGYLYISHASMGGSTVQQAKDGDGNLLFLMDSGSYILDLYGNQVPVWDLKNSGTYMLSVVAVITNENNVYFESGGQKVYSKEFDILLNISKSNDIQFTLETSEGISEHGAEGIYDMVFKQVYNGIIASFAYNLFASGVEMTGGGIPVTIAVNNVLYSYNNNKYSPSSGTYGQDAANSIIGKVPSILYTLNNQDNMLNVTNYKITAYINYTNGENYNSNYNSLEYTYQLQITKAQLKVYIDFMEGHAPEKIYKEPNSSVEPYIIFNYSGWVANEGKEPSVTSQIVSPEIDWSNVPEDAIAGEYRIWTMGGMAPSNYQFDHESSYKIFTVKKAVSWVIVYGFLDSNDIYTDYNIYSGKEQQPNVLRMTGNELVPEDEVIGEGGIQIILEGAFIGSDKSNILPKDIDTSVKSCFNVGKYVFSVSVRDSTNYQAVPKAYYYYEVKKAELSMVFVTQEFDGENYTITEVVGYSSKIYDGNDTEYPIFNIQYKGFVGEDSKQNNYKNMMKIAHVGELVYVIVDNQTFQSIAQNFDYIQDGGGKYFKDTNGNYIMLNTKGNYIKDASGKYISVVDIKGDYYLDGEEYRLINGSYIKLNTNEYVAGASIEGNYVQDSNNDFVLVTEVEGKYALTSTGMYVYITDTYFRNENAAYINILDIVGVYFKEYYTGEFIKAENAVGKYFKNAEGEYIHSTQVIANYIYDEETKTYIEIDPEGEIVGTHVLDENGEYVLASAACLYIRDYDGNYKSIIGLQGNYVKSFDDGSHIKVSDIIVCNYIKNSNNEYEKVSYINSISGLPMLFFMDSKYNYIDCDNIIGTHVLDEYNNFVKVRTHLGNLVSFEMPYVRIEGGEYALLSSLTAEYVKDIDGNYIKASQAVAEYIRNSVGDYLKVADILEQKIKDENGNEFTVESSHAKYFCDEFGQYFVPNEIVPLYAKVEGGFVRIKGDYVRLESFEFVHVNDLVYNYILDSDGNYIKIREEDNELVVGVVGNYVLRNGQYVSVEAGDGTHILDENGQYVRVNGDYNMLDYGIHDIGLTNPVYEIFNNSGAILPTDVNVYNTRVLLGDGYGTATNYNINVEYKRSGQDIYYPQLDITPRPIDLVHSNTAVSKVYDATDRILDGNVTSNNYNFIKVFDNGNEVENSGIISSDIVNLDFNYNLSHFENKNVSETIQNYVRIYGYKIDNPNYILQVSQTFIDDTGEYIRLLANIMRATASIRFVDSNNNNIVNSLEVVYDATAHKINAVVQGVRLDSNTFEELRHKVGNGEGEYTIRYTCANNGYDSEDAPTNAERYLVTLTIDANNYVSTQKYVELIIKRAKVKINFTGETAYTYGDVVNILKAEAVGVGGYVQSLDIYYYDSNSNYIRNIVNQNAGIYTAKAVHSQTDNFEYSEETEPFIINRRNINLTYEVQSSYSYTGKPVAPNVYFVYDSQKHMPNLKFNYLVGNTAQSIEDYPSNVGSYQLQPINDMQNFFVVDTFWTNFSIVPVDIVVSAADIVVLTNKEININYVLDGAVNGEGVSKVFTKMPLVRYYNVETGQLVNKPTENSGLYRAEPYGGESLNYNIVYGYGVLSVNNSQLYGGSSSEQQQVIIQGSFAPNLTLITREITNKNFSGYTVRFDAFKVTNADYADYNIVRIYHLSLSDGSVALEDNSEMLIKLYAPELFNKTSVSASAHSNIKQSANGTYYVAHIDSSGEVTIIEGYQEGDYICFMGKQLDSYCILSKDTLTATKNDDWIMYVSLAFGMLFVAVALILVKKRA